MQYRIIDTGGSRSFAPDDPVHAGAAAAGEIVLIIGDDAGAGSRRLAPDAARRAILVELGMECLGVHTGEQRGAEGSTVLGFARFRLGDAPPSKLIEVVCQPRTSDDAIAAARELFEAAGLQVAVCGDFPGRIVNRLVRPYYNVALRRLDEGLASADDLDTTLRLGLGYPEGPIALLEKTGLADHFDVSKELFEALGDSAYAPARRARVAKMRSGK